MSRSIRSKAMCSGKSLGKQVTLNSVVVYVICPFCFTAGQSSACKNIIGIVVVILWSLSIRCRSTCSILPLRWWRWIAFTNAACFLLPILSWNKCLANFFLAVQGGLLYVVG